MKKIIFIAFCLFILLGCIETGEIPKLQESLTYEHIDLVGMVVGEESQDSVFISNDKKIAKIELTPDLEETKGFLGMSLDIKSTRPLKLNSIYSNETHNNIDLNSVTINSFFEKRTSNILTISNTPTFESKKVKQTIIVENKENIEKNITLSLTFDINTTNINSLNKEISITADKPVVFKTDNYELNFDYLEVSSPSFSFSYFSDNEMYHFDWTDMKDTEHAVIIKTDDELTSHIEIQSIIHLNPLETVVFDPSYSERDLASMISITSFYGVSDLTDIKIGDINGDYVVMSKNAIYYIKNDGSFVQSRNDINKKYAAKFIFPSGTTYEFTSIDIGDYDGDGKEDILTTIHPIGAFLIKGNNIVSGLKSITIDPYNPGPHYSFVAPLGSYYIFNNAHIIDGKICFGVGNYPQGGTIYSHNVFCYNSPFSSSGSFDDLNALKFNADYDFWYRQTYSGGPGCPGVPYYFNSKLYIGAPCVNGISIIDSPSGTLTYTEPTNIGPSGFGSKFTHFDNSIFVLANNRILKTQVGGAQVDFINRPGLISLDSNGKYVYAGALGEVYIVDPDTGEIILEINGDISGPIAAGSLGILTDEGFVIVEITEEDLEECSVPPISGPWLIDRDTVICSGNWNGRDTGSGYIQVTDDYITITCEDDTIINGNGYYGTAIKINDKIGITLENCKFEEYDNGVIIEKGTENSILNNHFDKMQNTAIYLKEGKTHNIIGNKISEGGTGIRIQNSNNNILSDNIIYENTQTGIIIGDDEMAPGGYGNSFSNNKIINNQNGLVLHICNNPGGVPNTFNSDIICDNSYENVIIEDTGCWSTLTNSEVTCDSSIIGFCDIPCNDEYTGCVNLNDPSTYAGRIEFNSDANRFDILESITLCENEYILSSRLYFTANSITLDCNSSLLISDIPKQGTGIFINGYDNSIIKNCHIKNFDTGIGTSGTGGGTLLNLQVLDNQLESNNRGIDTQITRNILIKNNKFSNNQLTGLRVLNSGSGIGESEIKNNFITDSNNGMELIWPGSAIVKVHNNTITNNINGIHLSSAANYDIYDNTIERNTNGIYLLFLISGQNSIYKNTIINNQFGIYTSNIMPIVNQYIYDNDLCSNTGDYDIYLSLNPIGSIVTDNYCGTGRKYISGSISDCSNSCLLFASGCVNLNDPGTFNLDGDSIQNIEISGENYFVNQDVTLCRSTYDISRDIGLRINAPNIILDCNGSILNGVGALTAIYNDVLSGTNVTVKNCIIQNFETVGIDFVNGADEGKILNNTLIDNSGIGIEIADSQNCLVEDNILINNYGGIWLDYNIDGTQINNNYMCDNTDYDIVSAELTSAGVDNTCTLMPSGSVWNDTGATGCTNKCPSTSANVCAHVESLSTPLAHGATFDFNGETYTAIGNCTTSTLPFTWIDGTTGAPKKYVITANLSSAETCLEIGANNIEIEGCNYRVNGEDNYETWPAELGYALSINNKQNILIKNIDLINKSIFKGETNEIGIKTSKTREFEVNCSGKVIFEDCFIAPDERIYILRNSKVEFRNSIINPETTRELTIRDNSQTTFNNTNIENIQIIYIPKNTIPNVYVNNIDTEADRVESANITSNDDSYQVIFKNVEQTGIRQIFESYLSRDSLDSDEEYNLKILNSKLYSLRLSNNTKTKIENSYLGFEESDISYPPLEIRTSASNSKTIFDNSNISYFVGRTISPEDQFHIGGNLTILNEVDCSVEEGDSKIFIRQYPVLITGADAGKCLKITAKSKNLGESDFIDYEIIRTSSEDSLVNLICKYVNADGTVEPCDIKITTIDDIYCVTPTS
ncbi:right-handed parallel beta-helix repeat-containing protein [Candidatus Micrarchaeota archaeon]|nr:right-handed parallel beta-helix repeat-containing protein [Candidatus Micrarchaeota archaeon]